MRHCTCLPSECSEYGARTLEVQTVAGGERAVAEGGALSLTACPKSILLCCFCSLLTTTHLSPVSSLIFMNSIIFSQSHRSFNSKSSLTFPFYSPLIFFHVGPVSYRCGSSMSLISLQISMHPFASLMALLAES